jgi:hypothetical protein
VVEFPPDAAAGRLLCSISSDLRPSRRLAAKRRPIPLRTSVPVSNACDDGGKVLAPGLAEMGCTSEAVSASCFRSCAKRSFWDGPKKRPSPPR